MHSYMCMRAQVQVQVLHVGAAHTWDGADEESLPRTMRVEPVAAR